MLSLSVTTDQGELYTFEVESSTDLSLIKTLIEAETGISASEQVLLHNGKVVSGGSLSHAGIMHNDIILVRGSNSSSAGNSSEMERMRLAVLSDPATRMAHVPGLVESATSPSAFHQMLHSIQQQAQQQQQDDPLDIESQKKIEDHIRQQNVQKNMELALEHNPEVFGRVHMLHVQCEVNGHPVKAFIDSGAQMTVISPKCADECGILKLCDTRFSGIAKGVGTSKILGRVHSSPLKFGASQNVGDNLYLDCSFTVTEFQDSGVELLIGLDMLKRFQACIDLCANVLRIGGFEIGFLSENELPPHARLDPPPPSSEIKPTAETTATSAFPEEHVQSLVGLGATREQALAALKASDGNVEIAAGFIIE